MNNVLPIVRQKPITRGKRQHKRDVEWKAIAEEFLKQNPQHELEIEALAKNYAFVPGKMLKISDVVEYACKNLPDNIIAKVGFVSKMTGIIDAAFKIRVRTGELVVTAGPVKRKGDFYSLDPNYGRTPKMSKRQRQVVTANLPPALPVTPASSGFATKASVDTLALEVQKLSHTVGKLVQGLGGI